MALLGLGRIRHLAPLVFGATVQALNVVPLNALPLPLVCGATVQA